MKRPIIPPVICFCCGLLVARHTSVPPVLMHAACVMALVLCGACAALQRPLLTAGAVCVLFVLLGISALRTPEQPGLPPSHLVHFADMYPVSIEGIVVQTPAATAGDRQWLVIRVTALHTPEASRPVRGKLLLTIDKSSRLLSYGDRVRFLARMKRPRNYENPGGFRYTDYLAWRSIYVTAFLPNDRGIIILERGQGNHVFGMVEAARSRIGQALDRALSPDQGAVMKALLLGDRRAVPDSVQEQFSRLGIAHLLAISGLHMGIIALAAYAVCWMLFRIFPGVLLYINGFKLAVLCSILPVAGYCLIAGLQLPAVRAACMLMAYAVAALLNRKHDVLNTLFVAAFVILLFMPGSLFDVSFQLSFSAVLSLVLYIPVAQRILTYRGSESGRDLPVPWFVTPYRLLAGSLVTTVVAMLGTAPLVMQHFNRVSLLGFLVNIIAVPYVGFMIVPLGLMGVCALPFSPVLAQGLFAASGCLVDLLLAALAALASVPWAEVAAAAPATWETLAFYSVFWSAPYCIRKKKWGLFLSLLLAVVLAVTAVRLAVPHDRRLRVTFLDVGKGDAALVQFPDGRVMLIDGGGSADETFDVGKAVIAPVLYHKGIMQVDYVVMSHPHGDHIGGLPYIVRNFKVRELWSNGQPSGSWCYKDLLRAVEQVQAKHRVFSDRPASLMLGGVTVEVLPGATGVLPGLNRSYGETNDNCLVLRISFGAKSFLFTGDIGSSREHRLVSSGAHLSSTVLKVPHHGRVGSSSDEFISAVSPEIAVLSGRAPYARKSRFREVEAIYRKRGVEIFSTDRYGAVSVQSDGRTCSVSFHNESGGDYREP